ncbi:hypothetical protein GALMADRAFT_252804, partial [Galerina marginata CBS 339.88]
MALSNCAGPPQRMTVAIFLLLPWPICRPSRASVVPCCEWCRDTSVLKPIQGSRGESGRYFEVAETLSRKVTEVSHCDTLSDLWVVN